MILLWFAFDILGAMYGGARVAYLAHIGGFVAGFALAVLLLKTKVIAMERDEKSILELLGLEKKDTPAERRGDYAYWQQEWRGEEKGPGDEKQQMQKEALERQAAAFETQEPPERFIHFTCRCGQRIKMPGKYAGLIGRCPKCSARLKIPAGQEDIE
ncbi:MAG: rhomboid family intramembrane serine protease [Planctomycetes bacterium]|nr:rhomboid family intramembrane serine protease [Planctomycetota bacterium]